MKVAASLAANLAIAASYRRKKINLTMELRALRVKWKRKRKTVFTLMKTLPSSWSAAARHVKRRALSSCKAISAILFCEKGNVKLIKMIEESKNTIEFKPESIVVWWWVSQRQYVYRRTQRHSLKRLERYRELAQQSRFFRHLKTNHAINQ